MDRYGKEAGRIWKQTVRNYKTYLKDLPDYGGKKNGHARAIYGGLLVFALYPALPDEPPIDEMQEFVNIVRKTWLKEAGITDVNAFFSLEDETEIAGWGDQFASVTAKSYMRGYRDIYRNVGLLHKLMIRFCDGLVRMKIVKIVFGG